MIKTFLFIGTTLCTSMIYSQNWSTTGNNINGTGDRFVGTLDAASLRFKTEGIHLASFTYGNSLSAPIGGGVGDGLRIFNATSPTNTSGVLDLFTTSGNKTHVQFSSDGSINGKSGRMDYLANGAGFWFNTPAGRAIWNRGGAENARMGANSYWRFGLNSGGADAARRVEIADVAQQLRLSQGTGSGIAEFFVQTTGNLLLMPSGQYVGFTNVGDVSYTPSQRIDVNGTGRFRIVDAVATGAANCLFVGTLNTGTSDFTMKRLDFNGNADQALLGDGTWGTIGSVNDAHNGLSKSLLDATKISFGQDAFEPFDPGKLLSNREIPLNRKYVHFSDKEIADVGYMGLGSTFAPDSRIKFSIYNDTLVTSQSIRTFSFSNSFVPQRTSLFASTMHAYTLTGLFGQTIGAKTIAYGVRGRSISNEVFVQSIGAFFEGLGDNQRENNGVRGFAKNSAKINIGGKFAAMNDNVNEASLNIGVYGEATGVGSAAAYFVGNVVTTGSSLWLSDSTYKDSIVTLGDNIDSMLNSLNPVSFKFNNEAQNRLNAGSDLKLGFLAQEIGSVYPWLVKEVVLPAEYDTLGIEIHPESTYKAVDVTQLIPILVSVSQKNNATIAELNTQNLNQQNEIDSLNNVVDDLNDRLSNLENCLSGILPFLCQLSQNAIQANTPEAQEEVRKNLTVELNNRSSIILDQNVPNPFAEQTVINFSIPATVQKAQIHFYDGLGKLIQSVDVTERGLGSLTVFGSDLSTGVYTYTLVADGQIVATKKMMKQ